MKWKNKRKGEGRGINKGIKIYRKEATSISIEELILNAQQNQKSFHRQLIFFNKFALKFWKIIHCSSRIVN